MNCKVIISGGKERGGFYSLGDMKIEENGFRLDYAIENDACTLLYDGKSLRQTRAGSVFIDMLFTEGKQTECTLGEGGLSGSMTVFTQKLSVAVGKGGVKVKIDYDCGGERVNLTLTAVRV